MINLDVYNALCLKRSYEAEISKLMPGIYGYLNNTEIPIEEREEALYKLSDAGIIYDFDINILY